MLRTRAAPISSQIDEILMYNHEELPMVVEESNKRGKIDLTINRRLVNRKLHSIDFLACDCHTGEYYRLMVTEDVYYSLPGEVDGCRPCSLFGYAKSLSGYFLANKIKEVQRVKTGDTNRIVIDLFKTSPIVTLEPLVGKNFDEFLQAAMAADQDENSIIREKCRERWCEFTAEILRGSRSDGISHTCANQGPKPLSTVSSTLYALSLLENREIVCAMKSPLREVNYLTALRHELSAVKDAMRESRRLSRSPRALNV